VSGNGEKNFKLVQYAKVEEFHTWRKIEERDGWIKSFRA
jgi:hypothetical protein